MSAKYRKYEVTITGTVEVSNMTLSEVKEESSLHCMGCPVEGQRKTVRRIKVT